MDAVNREYDFHGAVVVAAREEGFPIQKINISQNITSGPIDGAQITSGSLFPLSVSTGIHNSTGCSIPMATSGLVNGHNGTGSGLFRYMSNQSNHVTSIYSLDNLSISNSQQNIR